jgi:hypothetical protein
MTKSNRSQATMNSNMITQAPNTTHAMKRTKTSILPDMESNVIDILVGYYWPRVLHRENVNSNKRMGKKEEKKVKKAHRQRRGKADIRMGMQHQEMKIPASPLFAPASPISNSAAPAFDTMPSLVLEEPHPQRMFSTITGRPIAPASKKMCGLLPGKSLREMQRQRTQSHKSVLTLD